jgi:Transcriptional regulator containing an amidase domain and an AraC-type DNA-binding HTH domain
MEKIMQGTDFMVSTGKNLSLQIFNDMNVAKLLYNNSYNYADINIALTQLGFYRQTTPYINSIYVYNEREKTFYISSDGAENSIQEEGEFYDKGVEKIVNSANTYKFLHPIPRSIKNSRMNNGEMVSDVYTFIYSGVLTWERKPEYAVIVNISAKWMEKLTDGLNQNSDSNTFLIDKNGKVVSYSYRYPIMSDISNQDFIKKILYSEKENGNFIEKIGQTDMFINYLTSKGTGWYLVQITPYITIVKEIKQLRNNTILTAIFILLAGLLAIFLLSRKIYVPIEIIISKLSKLEMEKIDSSYKLKQEFLRDILLDSKLQNTEIFQDNLVKYEVKIDTVSPIILVLILIDHYQDFCNQYNIEDRKRFKLAMMKISAETFAKLNVNIETVDMGDDKIVLFLNMPAERTGCITEIYEESIKNIKMNVLNNLKISITVVLSTHVEDYWNLSNKYNNLLEVSYHRMVYGYGSIIYAETVNEFRGKYYKYSFEKEKLLLDNVMLGNMSEVKKVYLEIINDIKEYSFMTIQFVLSRVVFSINLAIETMKKNSFVGQESDININSLFFSNSETLDEINGRIFNIFDHISENLHEKKSSSYDYVINKIKEMVYSEYSNPDLSIFYLAERMNLSQIYISRLFKKHVFKSIIDYILEIRMEKAYDLLISTDSSIEEIAKLTGFSTNVYFHKSYKKFYGVTPGEHRLKAKMQTNHH